MKHILISTIVRNREPYLDQWHKHIKTLCDLDKQNKYYLSVYENDSTDGSLEKIKSLDFSFLEGFYIKTERLSTPIFDSHSKDFQRVNLISQARNKSIYSSVFLNKCSHLLSIEPDIIYNSQLVIDEIINKGNYDIISPRSVDVDRNCFFYDDWGTRREENDHCWKCFSPHILRNLNIIPVWTTYNCLCFYNAEPFKKFITFGPFNGRLNKPDCDTAVVCENFRKYGYNNIVLNSKVEIYHSRHGFKNVEINLL
jgi:hypothetical protein